MLRRSHNPDAVALSALVDGALPAAEADALESHVASCDACRRELDGMRAVRAMLRTLPEHDAPRSFRLRRADVEAPVKRGSSPLWYRAMPALSAAALVAFATLVAVDASRSGGDESLTALSAPAAEMDGGEAARNAAPAPSGADAGGMAYDDSFGATAVAGTQPKSPPEADASTAAGVPPDASFEAGASTAGDGPSTETTQATDSIEIDDDGGPGAMRIAQWAMLALAAGAATVAAVAWVKRREKS